MSAVWNRWSAACAAVAGLLLAAPAARADLFLSIEPAGITHMGYFHVMLTNGGSSTVYLEGVNVSLTLGNLVESPAGSGTFVGVGTSAATITAVDPPQFSVFNSPPFPFFTSDPSNFGSILDFDPTYPGRRPSSTS